MEDSSRDLLLLLVFLVHLGVFATLWVKRRRAYYLPLVAVFTALVVLYALRLLGPPATDLGVALEAPLRAGAYLGTGLFVVMRVAAWRAQRSQRVSTRPGE